MKKIIALLLMFGVLFTANAVTSTRTVSIEFDVDKPTTMSFNISNVVQGDPLTINWAAKEGSEAADLSLVDGIKFYIKDYPESSIIAYSNAIITNPTNGVGYRIVYFTANAIRKLRCQCRNCCSIRRP